MDIRARAFLVALASLCLLHTADATCSPVWGQCGGKYWTGSKCCEPGSSCKVQVINGVPNQFYSQCIPGGGTPGGGGTECPPKDACPAGKSCLSPCPPPTTCPAGQTCKPPCAVCPPPDACPSGQTCQKAPSGLGACGSYTIFYADLTADMVVTKPTLPAGFTYGRIELFWFNDCKDFAVYKGSFTGIGQDPIAGHFHMAPEGSAGPVKVPLWPNAQEKKCNAAKPGNCEFTGLVTGVDLSTLAGQIASGGIYVDFHTTANPAGAIRGQMQKKEAPFTYKHFGDTEYCLPEVYCKSVVTGI